MENLFKQKIIVILLLLFCIGLSGCSKSPKAEENVKNIVVPENLIEFSRTTAEEMKKSYQELGDDYCTDAYVNGETLVMVMNDEQIQNMLDYNDDWVKELKDKFENSGEGYQIIGSEDYTKVIFKYDENMEIDLQIRTIYGIIGMYAINYVITQNENWSVEVEIVNCHTGKMVAKGNLPGTPLNFGENEWANSY